MIPLLVLATLTASAQTPSEGRMGPVSVEHEGGPFGIGIAVGAPTGIAGKYWIEDWSSIVFSFGGGLGIYNDIGATGDYLFQFRPFDVGDPELSVQLHLGPGLHIGGNTAAGFGSQGRWLVGPREPEGSAS